MRKGLFTEGPMRLLDRRIDCSCEDGVVRSFFRRVRIRCL